ncbi:MAG: efflux RND transporter periplasmic adaptor subunit [Thermodesulfobacteriota bacterium]|nr:efflux RND transporter periplasmic adaptor subunit [Thermodesulfobacteriota bacterium]
MKRELIVAVLCVGIPLLTACKPTEKNEVVNKGPIPVRVERIETRDLSVIVESVGRLRPNREVNLSAEVPGIVNGYEADVGDRVVKNQILVNLKRTDYLLTLKEAKANLSAARARLDAAEKTFRRAMNLLSLEVIAAESYDRSEAEYKLAKAVVSQMEAVVSISERRLSKTEIKSPFEGLVTLRMVELGQNVGPGEPVISIADMKTMKVRIHLNERDYIHLDRDDPVLVKVEAFPEIAFNGHVDRVGVKADSRTNTFDVDIRVENPDMNLKAGLTARVFLTIEVIKSAVMIPQSSILYRETKKEVFVILDDRTAIPREVKLGQTKGSSVRILEGLSVGDNLVVSGCQYLEPGDKVILSK